MHWDGFKHQVEIAWMRGDDLEIVRLLERMEDLFPYKTRKDIANELHLVPAVFTMLENRIRKD